MYAFAWSSSGVLQIVLTPGSRATPTFVPGSYGGGQAAFDSVGDTTATVWRSSETAPGVPWFGQAPVRAIATAAFGPLAYWAQDATIFVDSTIPPGYKPDTAYIISNNSVVVTLYQPS